MRISTSQTPLNDITNLNIRPLDEALKDRKRKDTIERYLRIEQEIIKKGLARDLPTYVLYRYQFDDLDIADLANELGVSNFTLARLMKEFKIPKKTTAELKRGTHASEETRRKMSESGREADHLEYSSREVEIIHSYVGDDIHRRINRAEIVEALEQEGFSRTRQAIGKYIHFLRNPDYVPKKRILKRKTTRQQLTDIISEKLDELVEDSDTSKLVGKSKSDSALEKRKTWVKEVPIGHQKLLIYMADPENYKKLLGEDVRLVKADFRKKDCKSQKNKELYDRFHNRVRALEQCTKEDEEMINFADGWMRCDLIYRMSNGEYIVLEIKQNAVNKTVTREEDGRKVVSKYRNADRTFEQILGYRGGLGARIKRTNRKRMNKGNFRRIPRHVDGYIAAYEIQGDLKKDLDDEGIGYFEIPREEVDQYIEDVLDKRVENKKIKNKAKKLRQYSVPVVVERKTYPNVDPVYFHILSNPEETIRAVKEYRRSLEQPLAIGYERIVRKKHQFDPLHAIDYGVGFHLDIAVSPGSRDARNSNFEEVRQRLMGVRNGVCIGSYDERRHLVYMDGKVYSLDDSREHQRFVVRAVKKGKLQRNKVTIFDNSEIVEI